MLIERRLRLITPILAAKRSNNPAAPRRVFVHYKTPKGQPDDKVYLASDLKRWAWAFLEARDELDFDDVCLGAIIPCCWYSVNHTSTYNRKFRREGRWATEPFESVPAGHVMRINFTLSKHLPPNTDGAGRFSRPPDEAEFDAMLAHIGEHLGMSEWGHALALGRFEIRPSTNDTTTDNGGGDEIVPPRVEESYDFAED